MVGSEVNITDPQLNHAKSHIEKHISFLDILQRGEHLRKELLKKATQGELTAILELCLNMNEGNLSLPERKSHRSVVSTFANRDIPLLNKKKWMLKYNKMLYNIIHPALKEWKRKFRREISVKVIFCIHLKWLIKEEGRRERASALRKNLHHSQYR